MFVRINTTQLRTEIFHLKMILFSILIWISLATHHAMSLLLWIQNTQCRLYSLGAADTVLVYIPKMRFIYFVHILTDSWSYTISHWSFHVARLWIKQKRSLTTIFLYILKSDNQSDIPYKNVVIYFAFGSFGKTALVICKIHVESILTR